MPSFENLTDQLSIFRMQQLSSTEKLVAVALLSFRNTETGRCNPPICSDDPEKETICTRTGLKKRSVVNTIASLQEKGVISCVKRQNKPSDITFTVHKMHRAQNAPCTKCTAAVHDVHPRRAFNAPITDKEQIKNRQEYFSSLTTSEEAVFPENGDVSEPDIFDGEKMGSSNNSSKSSSKTEQSLADLDEETGLKSSSNKDNAPADDAEQKPEKAKKQKAVFCTTERPDDVDPDLWNDFITHRKAKRAPVTATVIKRMRSAATECQMTLSQAMEMTVTRGWQGFEARYVLKDRKESAGTRKLPAHKDPTIKFDDDYYNQRVDPNDIWGFLK